jgi:hypothetical protein
MMEHLAQPSRRRNAAYGRRPGSGYLAGSLTGTCGDELTTRGLPSEWVC